MRIFKRLVQLAMWGCLVPYMLVVIVIYVNQRDLLYHPERNQLTPASYNVPAQEVTWVTSDGVKILSWYAPVPKGDEGAKMLLFFYGNSGHLGRRAGEFKAYIERGYGVLAVGYRGYGKSEGAPSEAGLYLDAHGAMQWLIQQGYSSSDIILYGESLGSGVAVEMARHYEVSHVILESPYSSILDVATGYYPFLPVDLMLKDRFDSLSKVADIEEAVLILHGTRDKVVPYALGQKLFDGFLRARGVGNGGMQGGLRFITFEGKGHNNHDPELTWKEIRNFTTNSG